MSADRDINRRDLIVKTAGAAGAASAAGAFAGARFAQAQAAAPPGFADHPPFATAWSKPLSEIVSVNFEKAAPEIADPNLDKSVREGVKERHRIFSHLLMALIQRFWNGNKLGPVGYYSDREAQKLPGQPAGAKIFRYRGDNTQTDDPARVNWDRYVGHNIACLAVDARGEIIDFELNHNEFFRSSAEHAEARMVRRLFTLTQDFDTWKDGLKKGDPLPARTKSKRISLDHVTLYTSLESCAQCSGVMSLANVKRVVYLQNDFGAFQVGNIMFNLSDAGTSPIPIPASAIGLDEFDKLNHENLEFGRKILEAKKNGTIKGAFYVPATKDGKDLDAGAANFSPSITSFLCTDTAYNIFAAGAAKLNDEPQFPKAQLPGVADSLTNAQCLAEARRFYAYADLEGFRASPHRP